MNENICLPKEHYFVLMCAFILLTIFYIYSLNQKIFKLDLENILTNNVSDVNKITNQPIIIDSELEKRILLDKRDRNVINNDPELEKRILLDKRDRDAINDDLKPPERRDQAYAYPDRYVKNLINIPSRGLPDNYQALGAVVRKTDEKVLQLFGRQKYPGSNQWEYYVTGADTYGFPNKMPIKIRGDREIENNIKITIDWLDKSKGDFEVHLYDYNVPRYNPYDF